MFRNTSGAFYLKKIFLEIPLKTYCLDWFSVRTISGSANGQSYVGQLCSKFGFLDWFMTGPRSKIKDVESESEKEENCSRSIAVRTPYHLHNLQDGPQHVVNVTKEEVKLYYKQLQTIRHIEKASAKLFKQKDLRKFCPLTTGQEACAVGMRAALRTNDKVITSHRCHGWSYLMGVTPFGVLAELIGKQCSCARSTGGSVHMYAPKSCGANGILGAQVPIGAGLALASKLKRDGGVCLAVYGSSIANKGHIHESCLLAHMWKLPCVFVCENNLSVCPTTSYYTRSSEIPGILVDGTDVLAVRQATEYALRYANAEGPIVMELNTSTHALTPEMRSVVQQQRDPVRVFRKQCLDSGLLSTAEIRSIEKKVRSIVDQATRDAMEDEEVALEELTADMYADFFEPQIRNPLGMNLLHAHLKPSRFAPKSPRKIRKNDYVKVRCNHAKKQAKETDENTNHNLNKVDS